jgi:hypothetical protein
MPENYRRSVSRDFDDVVGSVGVRFREVGDNNFVNARAVRIDGYLISCWFYQLSEHCSSRFQFMFKTEHWLSDRSRFGTGDPNYTDATATHGGGNRDNGVV